MLLREHSQKQGTKILIPVPGIRFPIHISYRRCVDALDFRKIVSVKHTRLLGTHGVRGHQPGNGGEKKRFHNRDATAAAVAIKRKLWQQDICNRCRFVCVGKSYYPAVGHTLKPATLWDTEIVTETRTASAASTAHKQGERPAGRVGPCWVRSERLSLAL